MDHKLLLDKLDSLGIRGLTDDFFASYLADRQHKVKFNNVLSESEKVSVGVTQGSVRLLSSINLIYNYINYIFVN